MAVAFINYLYYPLVGRLLPNAAFGELQVIISSFLQLSIILAVLTNVSVNIYVNGNLNKKSRATVSEIERISLYGGFAILLIICLLAAPLGGLLKFSSPFPFIAIAIAFVIAIPSTFRNAYLQANKKFAAISLNSFIGSSSKILFSAILVLVALHTFGAVLGIALSGAVGLFLSNRQAVKAGYKTSEESLRRRKPDFSLIRPELPYAIFILFMSLLTTLQISIDVTLIKYFLPPETAGNYAAIATIARIIYFLTGSVLTVMLSSLSRYKLIKDNLRTLLSSTGLITVLGGAATLFFVFLPTFTVHLLFGSRYDSLAHYLPLLATAVFIGSLLNLFVTYHSALRHYFALTFLILGSLSTLTFVIINTKTIEHIVTGLLLGSGVALVGLIAFTAYISFRGNKEGQLLLKGKADYDSGFEQPLT